MNKLKRWIFAASLLLLIVGCSQSETPTPIAQNAQPAAAAAPSVIQAWTGRSVIITEILAHTDAPLKDSVELYNPTDSDIDIGGWFLTDDPVFPRQIQLSAELIVPAQSYFVLSDEHWGSDFALSEYGESIYLYATDGEGNLTGYVDGGEFDASPNGQSLGRVQTALATEFVLLSDLTLGAANAAPQVGPIVISEIMYEGGGPTNEYIILTNVTDEDVPLSYPERPDLVWEIRGGVNYLFPPNSVLPAQASMIVSRLDPDLFRGSGINLQSDVQLFGPYVGKLKNGGETIKLVRPDKPDTDFIPYVLVDSVSYADTAPWPLLLTNGSMAIRRIDLNQYGNTPDNWDAVIINQ